MLSEEHLQETWDIPNFVMTGQAMAGLVSEIRALRKVYEAGKKLAHQNEVEQAWAWDLLEAIAAYESGEREK